MGAWVSTNLFEKKKETDINNRDILEATISHYKFCSGLVEINKDARSFRMFDFKDESLPYFKYLRVALSSRKIQVSNKKNIYSDYCRFYDIEDMVTQNRASRNWPFYRRWLENTVELIDVLLLREDNCLTEIGEGQERVDVPDTVFLELCELSSRCRRNLMLIRWVFLMACRENPDAINDYYLNMVEEKIERFPVSIVFSGILFTTLSMIMAVYYFSWQKFVAADQRTWGSFFRIDKNVFYNFVECGRAGIVFMYIEETIDLKH